MKRLINVRPLLLAFLCLAVGILCGYAFLVGEWWLLAGALFVGLCLTVVFALTKLKRAMWATAFACLFLVLGFGALFGVYAVDESKKYGSEVVVCQGVATDDVFDATNSLYVVLRDVTVSYASGERKLDGRMRVRFTKADFTDEEGNLTLSLPAGSRVVLKGWIDDVYLFKDGVDVYSAADGVCWTLCNVTVLENAVGEATFAENARAYIKQNCQKIQNADVMFALLTGDKSMLDAELYSAFRRAGAVHLLAVSGLHVGFLVLVFEFILKKFRLPAWVRMVVVVSCSVAYAYVCGFPSSVTRAVTMTFCVYLCSILGRRVDVLNSMSLAGLLLLTLNPLNVFSCGFLLSFGAVFGLTTFSSLVKPMIKKLPRFLNKVVSALAASFGATLGTVGFSATFFGYFSVVGIFFNVLFIPMTAVAFVLSAFGMIPFLTFLLIPADYVLRAVIFVVNGVAELPFATLTVYFAVATVFILLFLFVLGGYVNLKGKGKVALILSLALMFTLTAVLENTPTTRQAELCSLETESDGCFVVNDGKGNFTVVGNLDGYGDCVAVADYLSRAKLNSLTWVAFDTENLDDVDEGRLNFLPIDKAFVLTTNRDYFAEESLLETCGLSFVAVPREGLVLNDVSTKAVYDGVAIGASISFGNVKVVCELVSGAAERLLTFVGGVSAVVCKGNPVSLAEQNSDVLFFSHRTSAENVFASIRFGNWTLTQKGDKLLLKL